MPEILTAEVIVEGTPKKKPYFLPIKCGIHLEVGLAIGEQEKQNLYPSTITLVVKDSNFTIPLMLTGIGQI